MRVLLVNKFLYKKGGDAISTLATGELLKSYGHDVCYWGMQHPLNPEYEYSKFFVNNVDYHNKSFFYEKLRISLNMLYSFEAKRKFEKVICSFKPDVVHLNNFAHQISPSILNLTKQYSIPTVMTMHDYKIVCPSYTLRNNGEICEKCAGQRYYNCFFNKCTHRSAWKSMLNTIEMYLHHKFLRIYDLIDVYISPSKFMQAKMLEMGLKKDVEHVSNFAVLNKLQPNYEASENSIVYFGRLSSEKGLNLLLDSVKGLDLQLKIIGEGPLRTVIDQRLKDENIHNVKLLGYKTDNDLYDEVKRSIAVVVPSQWYENNPRSVIESFALGKIVIGAKIGGIPELINNNQTGFTFKYNSSKELHQCLSQLKTNKDQIIEMGKNARAFAERNFSSEIYYDKLMKVYSRLVKD